jgi:hypothetical protein
MNRFSKFGNRPKIKTPGYIFASKFAMDNSNKAHKYFGTNFDRVEVVNNDKARLAMINPQFLGENFGCFQIPTLNDIARSGTSHIPSGIENWGLMTGHGSTMAIAPPESGRSVLLEPISHPFFSEVLAKGIGPVERFIKNNKLRCSDYNFNGFLELSEACRDFINSEILHALGANIVRPLGIVEHNQLADFGKFQEWSCNYIRGFICQTRLSNLFDLSGDDCKVLIDHSIQCLSKAFNLKTLDYSEYFYFVLDRLAKTSAIFQAAGYTQDSLHAGQITLAGESVDLGIGHFRIHEMTSESFQQVLHPWFRFERQPILFQNFLYRTHSLKSEPEPVELPLSSETRQKQESLLGVIRKFAPNSARKIELSNPVLQFWERFKKYFNSFEKYNLAAKAISFKKNAWSNSEYQRIYSLSGTSRDIFFGEHKRILTNYESQIASWDRPGLPNAFLEVLRIQCKDKFDTPENIQLFSTAMSQEDSGFRPKEHTWIPQLFRTTKI